ncbi:ABC transporter substrate-binding protein [Bifidobacterium sp. AGR2158]|uniref:ABC transporter substrate-binding protein n=1 Tax=Bifidobacterium sp. AGR2158 TaxID=1280675 RepID=UPI0004202ECB|nr:ABC transporter substrate-binding protein [Bifidobacterium sp. AGR2158]
MQQKKNMFRNLAALVLGASLCLAAGACGTSDDTGSGTKNAEGKTTQGYDVSKVETVDEIAALVPDDVKQDGKLTVGMDTSYAPAEFLAEDGKTPVGYDVDLSKALAKVMGLEAENKVASFDLIIPSVGSKYDLGISSFTITPERMDAVDFVSFYKAGSMWVTKKGNPDGIDPKDVCGQTIAVQTATSQEEEVTEMNEQCKADGKKEIEVLTNKLQTDVTTNVTTGKASAFYADTPVAGYAVAQTGGQLEKLGEDVGVTKQGVVVKKGDKQMAEAVQKAMQKLMDDGTYQAILEEWGVQGGAIDKAEINPTDTK